MMKIRLFGIANDSIVDGPGIRYTIFTQGCPHHCVGCHNPLSHDEKGGYQEDTNHLLDDLKANQLLDGVTFSGGEPFQQCLPLIHLAKEIKELGLNIIIYSGYTFEQLLGLGKEARELLSLCDILIDGQYKQDLRQLHLLYRGSSNQRIINIKKSLKENKVIECLFNDFGELII